MQADFRVSLHEALDHLRQHVPGLGMCSGDTQAARVLIGVFLGHGLYAVDFIKDFSGCGNNLLPGWCQTAQVLAVPDKQVGSQFGFQGSKLTADTRLCRIKIFGGLADIQIAGNHFMKKTQLLEFHARPYIKKLWKYIKLIFFSITFLLYSASFLADSELLLSMLDLLVLVFSGGLVGFAIGLTGVGGGSLMTPILLLMGYPAPVAIGTDLLYAAITKSSGVVFHHRKSNVDWKAAIVLAAGSIPVSLGITLVYLRDGIGEGENYESLLTSFLGVMLMLTALVIGLQRHIQQRLQPGTLPPDHHGLEPPFYGFPQRHTPVMTFILGLVLGVCVTMASVGAGAIGAAILFLLYPRWKATMVVGTGIAHAVPLTLVAGLGYLAIGLVDLKLLASLLIGSLPGIYLGTHVGSLFPDKVMRAILVFALMGLGGYFALIH